MNFLRKLFGSKPAPVPPAAPRTGSPAAPAHAGATPAPTPAPSAPPPSAVPPPSAESSFRFQAVPPPPARIETTLVALPSPLWLPFDSPAAELFPVKADDAHAPLIAFLGGSADLGEADSPARQFSNAAGHLSRALPLYLAEQVEFGTEALTRPLLSWVVKPTPSFVLGGRNWDDATAARHARQAVADDPADYLVITHLVCHRDPWTIELRLVRTIDAACLATATASCPATDPGQALPALTRDLLAALAKIDLATSELQVSGLRFQPSSSLPQVSSFSPPPSLSAYLLALDQLLAVLVAAPGPAAGRLSGEREIVESQLKLCQEQPASVPVRLLFAHTLRALKKARPEALPEFRARVEQLQKEKPLPEPAHSVTARVLAEAFGG